MVSKTLEWFESYWYTSNHSPGVSLRELARTVKILCRGTVADSDNAGHDWLHGVFYALSASKDQSKRFV